MFKNKIIVIYGTRQVGKTTLLKAIMSKYENNCLYPNCDEPDVRMALSNKTTTELRQLIGKKQIVCIDEAQMVRDVALTLKILADNLHDIQVIATGSSPFELPGSIAQPLTGRELEFIPFFYRRTSLDIFRYPNRPPCSSLADTGVISRNSSFK